MPRKIVMMMQRMNQQGQGQGQEQRPPQQRRPKRQQSTIYMIGFALVMTYILNHGAILMLMLTDNKTTTTTTTTTTIATTESGATAGAIRGVDNSFGGISDITRISHYNDFNEKNTLTTTQPRKLQLEQVTTSNPASAPASNGTITITTTTNKNTVNEQSAPSNLLELPVLKYPFHLLQLGDPRSGSTFQYELLKAIMYLKSPLPRSLEVIKRGNNIQKQHVVGRMDYNLEYYKSKKPHYQLGLFTSGENIRVYGNVSIPMAKLVTDNPQYNRIFYYQQHLSDLYNCSLCEIDKYQSFFDLTNTEITLLREYMTYYQDLRKCCGYQMSKYNFMRIHGCNLQETGIKELKEYPWCESKNLSNIEQQMSNHIIPHGELVAPRHSHLLWTKPGDCQKFQIEMLEMGLGFNKVVFNKTTDCPS